MSEVSGAGDLPCRAPWRRRTRLSCRAAALAIAGGLLLAACGSSKQATSKHGPAAGTAGEVATLLAGIPQHGNTLGNPAAPVLLEYFGDLQCPYCRRFTLGTLPTLIHEYVRAGRLKIEYRSFQTATQDPETFKLQQVAALAAGRQDKLWNYIELFYHEQGEENSGYVTESYLEGLAQQVPGLEPIAWTAARGDPALAASLASDERVALGAGVTQTPTFVLGHNGHPAYLPALQKLLRG